MSLPKQTMISRAAQKAATTYPRGSVRRDARADLQLQQSQTRREA